MSARHRAGAMIAIAALAGCTSILGIDKDYVEVSVFPSSDAEAAVDAAVDAPLTPPELDSGAGGPLPPPVALAAGAGSSCAVLDGGSVACWGENAAGELGDGTTTNRLRPVTTQALGDRAVAIAVGGDVSLGAHACALLAGGGVACWGAPTGTRPGDADAGPTLVPTRVAGVAITFVDGGAPPMIAAGLGFTCASGGGPTYCWGANDFGQLGDGTQDSRQTPAPVTGITTTRALVAGSRHACALTPEGAMCWGSNATGQLGIYGAGPGVFATPGKVNNSADAIGIAAGDNHSCMVRGTGKLQCWGANAAGQLGNGSNSPRPLPDEVGGKTSGLPTLGTAIFAGGNHTCALFVDGGVDCWGENGAGELGDGTAQNASLPVVVRDIAATPQSLALGSAHTCALFADGTASCWGAGGRLGDGTSSASKSPVRVAF